MTTSNLERFNKIKKNKNLDIKYNNIDSELVKRFLNSKVNQDKLKKLYEEVEDFYNVSVSEEEAKEFLEKFKKEFNDERFNQLINDCKKEVIRSIVTPFGLGRILSAYDKTGGNVTTIHNFDKGIVATEEDEQRYNEYKKSEEKFNREPYDKAKVGSKIGKFNENKKEEIYKSMKTGDKIIDGYTGKELGEKTFDSIKKYDEIDLEHITSVKEVETDHRNHLFASGKTAEERQNYRVNIATDDSNLTLTEGSLNRSKNDKDLKRWANSKISKDLAKKTGNPNMTNGEYYGLDKKRIEEEYNKSKNMIRREQLKNQVKKQGREVIVTGAKEAGKMGLQQAIGLIVTEFFTALFDEIIDVYKNGFDNGFDDEEFLTILKERIIRIGKRVSARWKDALITFKDGAISGFISNLVTVAINTFVTTGKRIVRIIREGIFSLFKAVKILLFPPENMSFEDRMHEAKKLLATGLIVSLGVIAEEIIDKLIKGSVFLEPFSDTLNAIFVGTLTGLSISMVVYYIDKKKNDKDALKYLISDTEKSLKEINDLLNFNGEYSFE